MRIMPMRKEHFFGALSLMAQALVFPAFKAGVFIAGVIFLYQMYTDWELYTSAGRIMWTIGSGLMVAFGLSGFIDTVKIFRELSSSEDSNGR